MNAEIGIDGGEGSFELQVFRRDGMFIDTKIGCQAIDYKVVLIDSAEFLNRNFCQV